MQERPAMKKPRRSDNIDAARGIIIIIMALDHTSLFTGYRIANEKWYEREERGEERGERGERGEGRRRYRG